jgi:hypothetical protein
VTHPTVVNPVSSDTVTGVVCGGKGATTATRSRARHIEGHDTSARIAYKTVVHVAGINVVSGNDTNGIDAAGRVPWPLPEPAPITSNNVNVPSTARTKP